MHEGHRKRILERLAGDDLQDHELLEILLFNAIPRKNTNDLAHALLAAFGSLDGVLHAEYEQLKGVKGIGESTAGYLRAIGLLYGRVGKMERKVPGALFSTHTFKEFLETRYRGMQSEVLEIFCLDGNSHVSYCARFTSENEKKVEVSSAEVTRILANNRPKSVAVAHNHPNASSVPSPADDEFTMRICMLCSLSGVDFIDHFIVGQDGTYSYRMFERLNTVGKNFNFNQYIIKGEERK